MEQEEKRVTLREYAEARGISYESARKTMSKLPEEIQKEHITKQGGTRYLNQVAVAELDKRRKPVTNLIEKVIDLDVQRENEALRAEKMEMFRKITELQETIMGMLQERTALEVKAAQAEYLLEQKETAEQEKQKLLEKLQEAEAKANSYVPSWFGFYRKIRE